MLYDENVVQITVCRGALGRLLNRNKPDKGHFVVPCLILKLTFCRGGYYPPVLITLSLLAADSRPYCEVLGETR